MCCAIGWGWNALGPFLAFGAFLASVVGLLLGSNAVERLRALATVQDRLVAGPLPLREPTRSFDEIDETHSAVARGIASELAAVESERNLTRRQIRMLDRLTDGLILVSDEHTVIYANVAAATLLGGRNPVGGSFIAAVRDHETADALAASLRTGIEARRIVDIAGEDRTVEAVIARVSDDPPEAVVVMRDITELAKLQTLRRDFVANVSHELRTPLSTVKILAETLSDLAGDGDEQRRFLEKIDDEVDSMSELVDDLLNLTQLESGRTPLNLSVVRAHDLLSEVRDRMNPIAGRHGIQIRTSGSGLDDHVQVDERRITQALINLVSNAVAHTHRGGSIILSYSSDENMVSFLVEDTGVGIPAEELDRIWERFYKVDRSRSAPGTGLGLAIVKHVVQAHGGTVDARSTLGDGSVFEIHLPQR